MARTVAPAKAQSASGESDGEADQLRGTSPDAEANDSAPAKSSKSSSSKKRKGSTKERSSKSEKKAKKSSRDSTGLQASKAFKTEVISKIPSLKTIRDFQAFPSFKAQLDDQSMVEFKKDQAVYVLPDPATMESPTDYPEQSQYWIATVKDIRAKSTRDPSTQEWTADPSEVFVVVEWFYKPGDVVPGITTKPMVETVKNADEFFGVKELIRSDHQSVISVFSCCEPVAIYEFHDDARPDENAVILLEDPSVSTEEDNEDTDPAHADPEEHPNPMHAAQANYFYRLKLPPTDAKKKTVSKKKAKQADDAHMQLALHCVCNQPYGPSIDIMRYCTQCLKWFHQECMTEFPGQPELPFEMPTDAADELVEIARFPIVRGGVWGLGGNINIVWAAREYLKKATEAEQNDEEFGMEDWEQQLGLSGLEEWRDWIQYMNTRKKSGEPIFLREARHNYQCPACDSAI